MKNVVIYPLRQCIVLITERVKANYLHPHLPFYAELIVSGSQT